MKRKEVEPELRIGMLNIPRKNALQTEVRKRIFATRPDFDVGVGVDYFNRFLLGL